MPPTEFASLTMDERWVHATPEQMLEWFVTHSRHRFRLLLEDLRALPDEPAAIVEGPQLFPRFVAAVLGSSDQALFLQPDLAECGKRLLARGPMEATSDGVRARENATARDVLIASSSRGRHASCALADAAGGAPLEEMIERAGGALAPVCRAAPRPAATSSAGPPVREQEFACRRRSASTREWLAGR